MSLESTTTVISPEQHRADMAERYPDGSCKIVTLPFLGIRETERERVLEPELLMRVDSDRRARFLGVPARLLFPDGSGGSR